MCMIYFTRQKKGSFVGLFLRDCVCVKAARSCLTLCDPMDHTIHGILQARIPEWVAFPFSRGSSQSRDRIQVSRTAGGFLPAETQGKPFEGLWQSFLSFLYDTPQQILSYLDLVLFSVKI